MAHYTNQAWVNELVADRSTSYWLKDALRATQGRDVIDALSDAEMLVRVLKDRFEELMR